MPFLLVCPHCFSGEKIYVRPNGDRFSCRGCDRNKFWPISFGTVPDLSFEWSFTFEPRLAIVRAMQFSGDAVRFVSQCMHCESDSNVFPGFCDHHLRSILHLYIAPSTLKNAGRGLFASKSFRSGYRVVPYHGLLLDRVPDSPELRTYTCAVASRKFVDSRNFMGVASLANDASLPGSKLNTGELTDASFNNCRFKFDQQTGNVVLETTIPVDSGDELLVSYCDGDFPQCGKRRSSGRPSSISRPRTRQNPGDSDVFLELPLRKGSSRDTRKARACRLRHNRNEFSVEASTRRGWQGDVYDPGTIEPVSMDLPFPAGHVDFGLSAILPDQVVGSDVSISLVQTTIAHGQAEDHRNFSTSFPETAGEMNSLLTEMRSRSPRNPEIAIQLSEPMEELDITSSICTHRVDVDLPEIHPDRFFGKRRSNVRDQSTFGTGPVEEARCCSASSHETTGEIGSLMTEMRSRSPIHQENAMQLSESTYNQVLAVLRKAVPPEKSVTLNNMSYILKKYCPQDYARMRLLLKEIVRLALSRQEITRVDLGNCFLVTDIETR